MLSKSLPPIVNDRPSFSKNDRLFSSPKTIALSHPQKAITR
ncbi:hypothetical protein amyaer_1492 [Microcystis aeruginosa NIES-2481]|nr:hypothetical protein amyaer_1492 [Microcystis aeruginosa NIES-2481]